MKKLHEIMNLDLLSRYAFFLGLTKNKEVLTIFNHGKKMINCTSVSSIRKPFQNPRERSIMEPCIFYVDP